MAPTDPHRRRQRGLTSAITGVLLAALAAAPAQTSAVELAREDVLAGPVLSAGDVLWASRDALRASRAGLGLSLPAPGAVDDLEVRGAEADAIAAGAGVVAVRRTVYACYPARPGEDTTSCIFSLEVLAGARGGALHRVSVPRACTRFASPHDSLAVAAGWVVVVEGSSDCRAYDPPSRLVAIDPARPARRRVLTVARGIAVRAEGDVVAWSDVRRRRIVVRNLRTGSVRRIASRSGGFTSFDVQADGTVVAVRDRRAVSVFHSDGRATRLAARSADALRVARDRVAGFRSGRFFVTDLRGRSRRVRGEAPGATFDFDGRRAAWVRRRELERAVICPSSPGPSPPCRPSPGRAEVTVRTATVAR